MDGNLVLAGQGEIVPTLTILSIGPIAGWSAVGVGICTLVQVVFMMSDMTQLMRWRVAVLEPAVVAAFVHGLW